MAMVPAQSLKKGGDRIGYSGHKHHKGEKVVAVVDRRANIVCLKCYLCGFRIRSKMFFISY